jgi:hypothetical protein
MFTQAAVHFLFFYAIFSGLLLFPIVYAAFFGHFKNQTSFFEDDDRTEVFLQIFLQVFVSIAVAYGAVKKQAIFLLCGLLYLIASTVYYIWRLNWLLFEVFDCDETECEFYGFSMLIYFVTSKIEGICKTKMIMSYFQ